MCLIILLGLWEKGSKYLNLSSLRGGLIKYLRLSPFYPWTWLRVRIQENSFLNPDHVEVLVSCTDFSRIQVYLWQIRARPQGRETEPCSGHLLYVPELSRKGESFCLTSLTISVSWDLKGPALLLTPLMPFPREHGDFAVVGKRVMTWQKIKTKLTQKLSLHHLLINLYLFYVHGCLAHKGQKRVSDPP